jgi:hypothetical protein
MLSASISYGRAGRVKTRDWFPDIVLAVVESQYDEYVEKNGGNILKLPESVKGNIPKTRNYVLDEAGPGEWVCLMDDDISEVGRFGKATGDNNWIAYDQDQFLEFLDHGCLMAEDLGTGLWGLNVSFDPRFYREYTPFALSAPILGPFAVHLASEGIRFDARLWLKEDFDLYLQHLHRYHKVLRFNSHYYKADHINNEGGQVSFRNYAEEVRQNNLLQKKWGKDIVRLRMEKTINPRIYPPIPGV